MGRYGGTLCILLSLSLVSCVQTVPTNVSFEEHKEEDQQRLSILKGDCKSKVGLETSGAIVFKVPDLVQDPRLKSLVPFTVKLKESISQNEKIEIHIDGNLAYSVWSDSDLGIYLLSGRVRSLHGKISASVLREGGRIDKSVAQIYQTGTISIPIAGDTNRAYKDRSKPGVYKFIFTNNSMGRNGHIGEIVVSTQQGNAHILLTPFASANPYGHIEGCFSNAKISSVEIVRK